MPDPREVDAAGDGQRGDLSLATGRDSAQIHLRLMGGPNPHLTVVGPVEHELAGSSALSNPREASLTPSRLPRYRTDARR
jgi:hypothetical protein